MSLVLGSFIAAALIVFPSLFSSFFKGFAFLEDLFSASGQGAPIFFLFDLRGGGLILPVLLVGVVLIVFEWRMKNKEAFLALMAVVIIGLLLSLPFIPPEWLWRFLLMEFIPIAIILGYSACKMGQKITLAIFLILVLFPLVLQSVEASRQMGPTINENGYYELMWMTEHVTPSDSVILVDPKIGYWIQYVTRRDVARAISQNLWQSYDHVLFLIQKVPGQQHPIPPGAILPPLFDGEDFVLFELRRPPA